jgi:hypothetical protein
MPVYRASGSIVAAGIFAILGGVFALLFGVCGLFLFSFSKFPPGPAYPDFMRPIFPVFWIFLIGCALFVITVGIQAIRLRNWARISMLIIAGCLLFFGVIGIGVIFLTIFVAVPTDPLVSKTVLAFVLAITYGIPIAIALWWLILLTRSSVIAQFHSADTNAEVQTPAASAFGFTKSSCPLPVKIVGWYLASFVLVLPLLPFFTRRFPVFFFGHMLHGPAAVFVLILYFALLFIPGFGLLLLKRWSYPLVITGQLLVVANGLYSVFSPSYLDAMRSMLAETNLPALSPTAEQMLGYTRFFNLLALLLPLAILITLVIARRDFYAAATESQRLSP